MGKILNFAEAKKENIEDSTKDDMKPIEEWDGEDWKIMFDVLAEMFPDKDPWDSLAMFISATLMEK